MKILLAFIAALAITSGTTFGDIVTWDGGAGDLLFSSANNWNPDRTPAAGDTFNIDTAVTVLGPTASSNNLPNSSTINLSNGGSLTTNGGVIRLNNSNINVGSGSALTGGFWDLDNGDITFANGAIANMSNWEQKRTNTFTFQLGATGFSTLTPGTFRIGTGGSVSPSITNATYNVDMAAYTGGVGLITLVDFTSDAFGMDNSLFQTAGGLNVLNPGPYTANLLWNDATEAIQLNVSAVTAVPEPSSMVLLGVGMAGIAIRRFRRPLF